MLQVDRLITRSLINIASGLISAMSLAALPLVLLRMVGHEVFSAWTLMLQFGTYIWFLNLGLPNAINRYVSHVGPDAHRPDQHLNLLMAGIMLLSALGVIGFVAVTVAAHGSGLIDRIAAADTRAEAESCIAWVAACNAVTLPIMGVSGFFLGKRRNEMALLNNAGQKLTIFLLVVLAAALHPTLTSITIAYVAAHLLALALNARHLWRLWPRDLHLAAARVRADMGALLRYSMGFLPWTLSMVLVNAVTVTLVATYDYPALAFYAVAGAILALSAGIHTAIFTNLLPEFASTYAQSGRHRHGLVLQQCCRASALVALVIGLPVLLIDRHLLLIAAGAAIPANAVTILQLLAIASIARMIMTPYGLHLLASNQKGSAFRSNAAEGLVNLLVSWTLAPRFGALGVAIGVLAGVLAGVAADSLINLRRDGHAVIGTRPFLKRVFLQPFAMAAPVAAYAALSAPHTTGPGGWIVGASCYAVSITLIYLIGIESAQRAALLASCGTILRRR